MLGEGVPRATLRLSGSHRKTHRTQNKLLHSQQRIRSKPSEDKGSWGGIWEKAGTGFPSVLSVVT